MHNYSQITEMYRDESGALALGGVDGKLLDILSKTLKFRYECVSSADGKWGSLSKFGNWTGLIGMVSGGQADMAIGFLAATKKRQEVVDFSEPYSVIELSFATHLLQTLPRTNFYFHPFNWSLSMWKLRLEASKNYLELCQKKSIRFYHRYQLRKYLLHFEEDYVIQLANAIIENNWLLELQNSLDDEHFDGKTAVLGVKIMFGLQFGILPDATKYISDAVLSSIDVGLAIRKDFCCKKSVDSVITRIKQAGLYQKLLNDEMYKTWIKTSETVSKFGTKKITLINLFGALTILLCGFASSIFVLVLEICLKSSKINFFHF
ncbi:uncharacterized protein TNCT_650841 [Trichonephila clavata]|uniref:Ionotropic glutamate receptor L-glutamate and glycine-binding domain-containing protein n=1 Tax=Trichonephila clavata TaxID=2740835 RepID=A0A8X6HK21_TRICU|nr:uncharacterized protein TNCT_650841 [Trichonephila clavata]